MKEGPYHRYSALGLAVFQSEIDHCQWFEKLIHVVFRVSPFACKEKHLYTSSVGRGSQCIVNIGPVAAMQGDLSCISIYREISWIMPVVLHIEGNRKIVHDSYVDELCSSVDYIQNSWEVVLPIQRAKSWWGTLNTISHILLHRNIIMKHQLHGFQMITLWAIQKFHTVMPGV